jgi:hypothetical protein
MFVNDSNLGRKKKKKTMSVDDGSLGRKKKQKKKEVLSVEVPKPRFRDLDRCTDAQTSELIY